MDRNKRCLDCPLFNDACELGKHNPTSYWEARRLVKTHGIAIICGTSPFKKILSKKFTGLMDKKNNCSNCGLFRGSCELGKRNPISYWEARRLVKTHGIAIICGTSPFKKILSKKFK
ncbi:MAG: hypothetical protein AB1641_12880 [Thermodesulfobacteriota bacterium]